MAIKVLDLDIAQTADPIQVGEYEQAFLLIRDQGRPVARVMLPTSNGWLSPVEISEGLRHADPQGLLDQKLFDYLDWAEYMSSEASLPRATVVVCTRNRPDDLKRCLDAFMTLPDLGQEFLVIDNCPSDNSSQSVVASYGDRIRYIREDKPGLNRARNRAIQEAHHEIVVFNDDDAVPDARWLGALLRNFMEPKVLCVTGLTMPLELETAAQEWFERYSSFSRGFRRRFFYGTPAMALKAGNVGAGANMAVRKSILEQVGPFDEALDAGTPTLSGGDTEMFARILYNGYHIIYDPAALSWHRHRRTWRELRKTAFGYGVGTYAVWTRRLVRDHQVGVLQAAWQHGLFYQLPLLMRAILRMPNHMPFDLILAELGGCLWGSVAYFSSYSRTVSSR